MEEKGVILYLYDYDEYVKDRDFNYPFLENVAGEICYSFDELLAAIGKEEVNRSNYEHIRRKFWGDYSGKATQQLIDKFLITIGKKGKI